MSSDIEQLSKALRELLEAYEARYPNAEAGQDAQTAWVMRQSKAREYAHACIAAHEAKRDSVHLTQPEGGTVPGDWRTVARDGLPKYQPEVTYIGINSAGFAACFTIVDPDGACWMNTGEENICVMSELAHWRVLDRPANK